MPIIVCLVRHSSVRIPCQIEYYQALAAINDLHICGSYSVFPLLNYVCDSQVWSVLVSGFAVIAFSKLAKFFYFLWN